jgi:hypothetical protein
MSILFTPAINNLLRKLTKLTFLLLSLPLEGCVSTIVPPPLDNKQEMKKERRVDPTYSHVGHQYLFVFPFGKVHAPGPLHTLQEFLRVKYPADTMPEIVSTSLKLNAYDLFFTRYLVCHVAITARCRTFKDTIHRSSTRYAEYSRYGFENDLSRLWYRCLKEAEDHLCVSS